MNYTKHDGEKKNFRKFFKFQVFNPISIKTTVHDVQHGIYLSAQIQNSTQSSLFLESLKLDPIPLFNVFDLSNSFQDEDSQKNSIGLVVVSIFNMKIFVWRYGLLKARRYKTIFIQIRSKVSPRFCSNEQSKGNHNKLFIYCRVRLYWEN